MYGNYDMDFWTNNQIRMTIEDGGNVGIGTTSPSQIFTVKTSAAGGAEEIAFGTLSDDLVIYMDDSAGNLDRVFVRQDTTNSTFIGDVDPNEGDIFLRANGSTVLTGLSEGNVGIGTDSPGSLLNIYDADSNATLTIQGYVADDGDVGGSLLFKNSHVPTGNFDAAKIQWQRDTGTWNTNLQFHTRNSSGVLDEAMRIDSSGNVGIGTTSPGAKLEIVVADAKMILNGAVSNDALITFEDNDAPQISIGIDDSDSNKFKIAAGSGMSSTNLMTIETGGNVGIGTTAPWAKLDVAGNIALGDRGVNGDKFIGRTAGASNNFGNSAWINFASNTADNWITFGTLHSGVDGGQRMIIDKDGNVGIGTDSPADTLTVVGTLNATNIQLASNCADGQILKWSGGVGTCGTDTTGATGGNSSAWNRSGTNVFLANTGDSVGIGTTSPGAKLDVNGALNVGGAFTNSKTSYRSIAGTGFVTDDADKLYDNSGTMLITGAVARIMANVELPHGAVVTKAVVYGANSDETYTLYRNTINSQTGFTAMASAAVGTEDTSIASATIDNNLYKYYLYIGGSESGDSIRSARITYTTNWI